MADSIKKHNKEFGKFELDESYFAHEEYVGKEVEEQLGKHLFLVC